MYSQKLHKLPQLGGWGEGERKLPERKHFGGQDDIPYRNLQVLRFYFSFRLIAFPQWMDKNEWMQGVHLERILRRYFLGWQWPAVKTYRWTLPHSTYAKKTSLQKDDHPKRKHLNWRPKGGRNCAPKTLDSHINFVNPNVRYFVAIFRFVAIYPIFGRLWAKKYFLGSTTVFLGQEVNYYMVYIAYFTELILQICDCAQKRRIWRENC